MDANQQALLGEWMLRRGSTGSPAFGIEVDEEYQRLGIDAVVLSQRPSDKVAPVHCVPRIALRLINAEHRLSDTFPTVQFKLSLWMDLRRMATMIPTFVVIQFKDAVYDIEVHDNTVPEYRLTWSTVGCVVHVPLSYFHYVKPKENNEQKTE